MATVRNMLNANEVFTRLAENPNIFVTTAFSLLPILRYLSKISEDYLIGKQRIIDEDTSIEEKEQKFNALLDTEIEYPEMVVTASSLRNCGLTMLDIEHIHWWIVDKLPDEEFED